MECGDQILRNFLNGLVIHLRGPMPDKNSKKEKNPNSKPDNSKSETSEKPPQKKFTNKKSLLHSKTNKKSN
jgi:hypothetical protein